MGCSERFTRDAAAPKPLRARRGVLMGAGGSHRPCGCPAPARRCTSRSHAGMGGLGFGASHPRYTVRSAQGCSERLRHAYALCMLHVHVRYPVLGAGSSWARAAAVHPVLLPPPSGVHNRHVPRLQRLRLVQRHLGRGNDADSARRQGTWCTD
jgi:hypothetical protein